MRAGTVLVVPRDAMSVGEPDEAALQALLEAEPDRFTAPEYRDLIVVTLTPDTILEEIEIDEAELREEYEIRQDFYTQPERRRVAQLLASDAAVIEAARDALDDGAVFAELAETMEGEGLSYATIGPTTEAELPPELAGPIFALDENAVSEPVESLFGWHLFRLIETEPEVVRSFDEVREEIRDDLARNVAIEQLPELAAALDDGIAAGETLEEAAAAIGVEARRFAAIDAEGRNEAGEPISDSPAADILADAFAAPVGETSLLEETSAGSFYMYRVDGIEAPRPRELAEVKGELIELWTLQEQDRLAGEEVEALMAEARAGRTLEAIAAEQGEPVTLRSFEPVARGADGNAVGLAPDAVAALFDTAEGELVSEPVPTAQGMGILRVDDVIVPEEPVTPELVAQLEAGIRNDILAQYEAALRNRYAVEINDAAIATLFPSDAF
jgi:peptidyl-prolyl cis-trans isomerase D